MPACRPLAAWLLGIIVMWTGSPAAADVLGRVARIGPSGGGAQLVREGCWTYVEVALSYQGGGTFSGMLEVQEPDRDGDIVRYRTRVNLGVSSNERTFRVYFVPGPRGAMDMVRVQLLDEQGRRVPMRTETGEVADVIYSDPYETLSNEVGLVLDLSSPAIGVLADSRSPPAPDSGWRVQPLDPKSLPDRWQGLEMVDVIVWDDPDPATVSPAQMGAIVDWVRFGGRLVLSSSQHWRALSESPLGDLLPVRLTGVAPARELQEFTSRILPDPHRDFDAYVDRHPIARCRMAPLPGSIPVPSDPRKLLGLDPLIYRRIVWRGTVTFVGAAFRDLLAPIAPTKPSTSDDAQKREEERPPGDAAEPILEGEAQRKAVRDALMKTVLQIAPHVESRQHSFADIDLFAEVRRTIGFQASSLVYLFSAVVFALVYSFSATIGSYWYLRRRNLLHHAWSSFTIIAVVGSIVGTLAVGILRGVRTRLEQTAVVDGQANTAAAVAWSLFGVRTPGHTRLDVRLPTLGGVDESAIDDDSLGFVRPLPKDDLALISEGEFVASESYECRSAGMALSGLPVRATLKELEGVWEGSMGGRLEAQLTMGSFRNPGGAGRVDRFLPGSHIRNSLGFTLRNCFLLETPEETAIKSGLVRAYTLGDIPSSGPGSELTHEAFDRFFKKPDPRGSELPPVWRSTGELETLQQVMARWAAPVVSVFATAGGQSAATLAPGEQRTAQAMLLLSTMSLYLPEEAHQNREVTLRRCHGRRLEGLYRLTRTTALLVGFADAPPPAVLSVNGSPLRPDTSLTMYRFAIPVTRTESAAAAGAGDRA